MGFQRPVAGTRRFFESRSRKEFAGVGRKRQQRLDFLSQGVVAAACLVQKCGSLLWTTARRLVIEPLDFRKSISAQRPLLPISSRCSHFLANCQSRMTVSAETPSASAVS